MTQDITILNQELITSLVINGDLSKLSNQQKVEYYKLFCERLGVDPITQPFKLLRLNGKEVMYCDRSGAQQLNKIHAISHEVRSREIIEAAGVYQVTARASLPNNRFTDSIGAVGIVNLKGDAYANAIMKAETKAKRRATLDLLGLGLLDETELETIPGAITIPITGKSIDELHSEYMEYLNDLIKLDSTAKQYHPDKWKGERNSENYIKAIAELKNKLKKLDGLSRSVN